MNEAQALEALAQALAEKVKRGKPAKPRLRSVQPAKPTIFDSITRESIFRRVKYLARAYALQWLVDQETFNQAYMECLDDARLSRLLESMERARECLLDGVAFEDAGLVRSNMEDMPDAP